MLIKTVYALSKTAMLITAEKVELDHLQELKTCN